jgi:hypothetical protein
MLPGRRDKERRDRFGYGFSFWRMRFVLGGRCRLFFLSCAPRLLAPCRLHNKTADIFVGLSVDPISARGVDEHELLGPFGWPATLAGGLGVVLIVHATAGGRALRPGAHKTVELPWRDLPLAGVCKVRRRGGVGYAPRVLECCISASHPERKSISQVGGPGAVRVPRLTSNVRAVRLAPFRLGVARQNGRKRSETDALGATWTCRDAQQHCMRACMGSHCEARRAGPLRPCGVSSQRGPGPWNGLEHVLPRHRAGLTEPRPNRQTDKQTNNSTRRNTAQGSMA